MSARIKKPQIDKSFAPVQNSNPFLKIPRLLTFSFAQGESL